MAKKNKPLLNEGTVRRMMKLANMEALGDGFISERYTPLEEEDLDEKKKFYGDKAKQRSDTGKGEDYRGVGGKHLGEAEEEMDFEAEEEDELKAKLGATEDELGAEDKIADEEGAELEGEVTITDEEAQDIIDLADKLKDAVGEPEVEVDVEIEDDMPMGVEAEEEIDLEEPGNRMYEEELYEAALKGLNIDIVDDKAEQRKALVQEAKKRIYERVIRRLLSESKK